MHSRWIPLLRAFLVILVLVTLAEFVLRGPLRSRDANDFASPYIAARRLLEGVNPYSPQNFMEDWHASGAAVDVSLDPSGERPVYPPTALIVFIPLAILRWGIADHLFVWASVALYLGFVAQLQREIGADWTSLRRLGFLAFAFGLSSAQTGFGVGNPSALAWPLCGLALYFARLRRELAAGLLLAVAFAVKPTSAVAAVCILLLYRRFRAFLVWLVAYTSVAGFSLVLIGRTAPDWRSTYQQNVDYLFGPYGAASFHSAGFGRFDLVNLQVPIYSFVGSVTWANLLTFAAVAVLCVIWLVVFRPFREGGTSWDWCGVGVLLLISLLPFYQRNYNVPCVLIAAFWCFRTLELKDSAEWGLLLLCPFYLLPIEAILRKASLPVRYMESKLWDGVLLPELTWVIVATILLLFCVARSRGPRRFTFDPGRPAIVGRDCPRGSDARA